MKSTFCSTLVLFSMAILVGCITGKPTSMPNKDVSPSPSSELATYTPLPTSIAPATQTATVTPANTLEPLQAEETITTLLRQPMDCPISCFWGIAPGQTTIGEAKNILTRLGLQSADDRTFEYKLDNSLLISVFLRVRPDSVVENLAINIVPEVPEAGTIENWSTYSPKNLIEEFGIPSRVDLALDWGPRPLFDMVMYFDDADLIVEYSGIISSQSRKALHVFVL